MLKMIVCLSVSSLIMIGGLTFSAQSAGKCPDATNKSQCEKRTNCKWKIKVNRCVRK